MTEAIINHLWQSTWCVVAAALLSLAFRANGAKVRFLIWFAASAKFLVPFSLFIWIGEQLSWVSAADRMDSRLSAMLDQIAQPAAVMTSNLAATPLTNAALYSAWSGWKLLLAVWLLGSVVLICYRVYQWMYMHAIVAASAPLDVDAPIPAYETTSPIEPGIFGIVSPVLVFPAGIATQLAPSQLEAIVAHELCHWRRRDNLTAAIHMLVEALFWFHPLVWWLGGRLVTERERACDEAVVRSGSDRHGYAEGILKVCQHYLERPLCSAGVSGGGLRQRIEEIMTKPVLAKLSMGKRSLLFATAVLAVVGPLAVGVSRAGGAVAAEAGAPEMRRYRNDLWRFELDVPTRWVVMPPVSTNSHAEVIRIWSKENGNHGLIVFRQAVAASKTAKILTHETQKFLTRRGFSNFVSGETVIGSRKVMTLDFERSAPEGGMWYCRHYIVVEGSLAYVLGFGSTNREATFELYDRMAKSFVFQAV